MTKAATASPVSAADNEAWADYLASHPKATFFHDWRWGDVLEKAYGYKPVFLAARRDGRLVGVAPLIDVRSPIFGRSLISTTFTVGGGLLADDEAAAHALSEAAHEEGMARRVNYVELRGANQPLDGWSPKTDIYAGFSRSLECDESAMLSAIPRKRRAEVRKGMKFRNDGRLVVRHNGSADEFYALYAQSLRKLGTPVFSRKFVNLLTEAFGDAVRFTIAEVDGASAVGLCTFYYRDHIMPYYIGMTDMAREARAGDMVYWSLMEEGLKTGATTFDFGRSKIGSPHELYKKTWGFEPAPLTYHYRLIGAKETPNVNPNNPKFAAVTALWKRLPLWAANRLGPIVARNLA